MIDYLKSIIKIDFEIIWSALPFLFSVIFFWIILRILSFFLKKIDIDKHEHKIITNIAYKVIRYVIGVFYFLFLLEYFGATINLIWTILYSSLAMLAIGFVAYWSILSNILAALFLVITHSFRIGETIELEHHGVLVLGKVVNISIFFTTIVENKKRRTIEVHIPNNVFFQVIIKQQISSLNKETYSLLEQLVQKDRMIK